MAGIKSYILADDVLILATGGDMLTRFAKALDATHEYLHSMGAKVAPDKSYNFASTATANKETRYFPRLSGSQDGIT